MSRLPRERPQLVWCIWGYLKIWFRTHFYNGVDNAEGGIGKLRVLGTVNFTLLILFIQFNFKTITINLKFFYH